MPQIAFNRSEAPYRGPSEMRKNPQPVREMQSRVFAGIGILAILALVVALLALFAQIYGNFHSTVDLAGAVSANADQAKADARRAIDDSHAVRQELRAVRTEIGDLHRQLGAMAGQLEKMRSLTPLPTRPMK